MEMLDHAVAAIKAGKEPSLEQINAKQTEIELRVPALLPEEYIFDVRMRLSLYKRIASCTSKMALDDIQVELIDRFGLLPQATKNLIHIAKLKLKAQAIGIARIDASDKGGFIEFSDSTIVDPMQLIGLMQKQPTVYKMDGANKLRFNKAIDNADKRFSFVAALLSELTK